MSFKEEKRKEKKKRSTAILVGIEVLLSFTMYNVQKYRVPKNSQCLKGSDYSLHHISNSTTRSVA